MTSGPSQNDQITDEILAGEYVVGALSADLRSEADERIADDPEFARRVRRWEAMLASFNDDYGEAAPPKAAFAEIERRLFGEAEQRLEIWSSLSFWRGISFASSTAAAAAVIYAFTLLPQKPIEPPLVALLTAPDVNISLVATYDQAAGILRVTPAASGQPKEKSLELWLVPGSGQPKSLGVFAPGPGGVVVIPEDRRAALIDGATLAVSVEPFGGSPTGLPTGQIVASGSIGPS
ncbi:anti-sigma factor [Chenggangzhangella methanolivorans]|uniref:Anti-sigma factor n=1 Tax=Chenggangzhangella methanolivorans TaxID=1437009 RepID=A0A9E6RAB8_9HYPH|nr:anti-sigma factor [Chenggangzhangella methanolivorans]QZO01091.1 anti-sigma factor [Chenggangzhangella methanolivorans]